MMSRVSLSCPIAIVIILLAVGCAQGTDRDPVMLDTAAAPRAETAGGGSSNVLWGMYEIAIDPATLEVEIVPLRGACFNVNVTQFMQPPMSPVNLIQVYIDTGASDVGNGLFAVDVTLRHPFPGLSFYSGFDVRGIFMADGSAPSSHYANLYYAAEDEAMVLNADGWTRWWNPTEFTTYDTIFGYTQGRLAPPGYTATATLNPYKYFCDGLGAEDDLVIDPATRGFFSTMPGVNTRRYMIQFQMDGGSPDIRFNYAVDASWYEPIGGGPGYDPDDFSLNANCREAYQLAIADAGSTAWYVSPTESGGDLLLDICVYDWQAVENPDGVPGEVAAIWVESTELMGGPVNVLPTATVLPDGPTSSVFRVEITDVTPTGLTDQTLMVAVESSSPTDYAPQLVGVTGFDYPEEALAAFIFWDAPIGNIEPETIPVPTGLDNCAAAGMVKLFWDPVDWPTLAGYNVYKKESTEPEFDFGTPLNTELVTETFYVDDDVLMDGTSYDYVVTAVDDDTTESEPSDMTTATPEYVAPTGFTDLDDPDGTMGSGNVSNIINADIHPDGTINLVWDVSGVTGIRFVRGDLEDGTWGTTVNVSGYHTDQPDVAVDSEGIAHILWSNYYTYNRKYYYATVDLDNNVENFTEVYSFTASNNTRLEPTIAIGPDDEVHMVFPGKDGLTTCLMYVHGFDPLDFSEPENITTDVYSLELWIQADLGTDRFGNVHLIWRASSTNLRYMYRNTDGDWSTPVRANQSVGGYPVYPKIAVDYQGAVHIAWHSISVVGYVNNRSNSFQGMVIPGSNSTNHVGLALDRDGNAYVDWYNSSTRRVYVALINRDGNMVESNPVNDDLPYQGAWPTFAGNTDPCWSIDTSTIAFWKLYPTPYAPPKFGRIQTDY